MSLVIRMILSSIWINSIYIFIYEVLFIIHKAIKILNFSAQNHTKVFLITSNINYINIIKFRIWKKFCVNKLNEFTWHLFFLLKFHFSEIILSSYLELIITFSAKFKNYQRYLDSVSVILKLTFSITKLR